MKIESNTYIYIYLPQRSKTHVEKHDIGGVDADQTFEGADQTGAGKDRTGARKEGQWTRPLEIAEYGWKVHSHSNQNSQVHGENRTADADHGGVRLTELRDVAMRRRGSCGAKVQTFKSNVSLGVCK